MHGMGRFVAVAFPVYLVLGRALVHVPFATRVFAFTSAATYLVLYSALYAAGYLIV